MIKSKTWDIEIFPNLFSVTFVDLNDYLKVFSDCVDAKGKPIALTDKYSVEYIKEKLDTVKVDRFWISDTNDDMLLELVAYVNKLMATKLPDGNSLRYDLFGYNSKNYDDYMLKAFLSRFNQFDTTKELIKYLYRTSKSIIDLQSEEKEKFYTSPIINELKNYRLPFGSIDVYTLYALNSAGTIIDSTTGERKKYGKSLKQTSINVKWHDLLDFTLPKITEDEYNKYYNKEFRNKTFQELTEQDKQVLYSRNDFDRYVLPEYVEGMIYYNSNDCFIVAELIRQKPDEVRLRYSISNAFNINVLSSSRSNISDKLLIKFYSERSGLKPFEFVKKRTNRTRISFNKIIFPHIKFKTKQLQDLLKEMMDTYIYHTTAKDFTKSFEFYGTSYSIGCGGIHSVDSPRIYKSDDKMIYKHHDYTSYYPSIMIAYGIYPAHLNKAVFIGLVGFLKDTRVIAKHTADEIERVIAGVPNVLSAEVLKIVINAIYGKLGYENFWLYDRLAQMAVTINGQLMTLSLIESLELAGIHTISANTDGIVIALPYDKIDIYNQICKEWNAENKMSADDETYKLLVVRDVNNYFNIQTNNKIEFHGALDPKQYIKDLTKGYNAPIVAEAVFEYFAHNTPVMTTFQNSKHILDFCKTQNVGKQFKVVYDIVKDGKITEVTSQRHVRFYVSSKGISIFKKSIIENKRSKLAGENRVKILNSLDDVPMENRDIKYSYYYEEAYKIINPIKLMISTNQKGNSNNKTLSGKALIKKHQFDFLNLFDEQDLN